MEIMVEDDDADMLEKDWLWQRVFFAVKESKYFPLVVQMHK